MAFLHHKTLQMISDSHYCVLVHLVQVKQIQTCWLLEYQRLFGISSKLQSDFEGMLLTR